MFLVGIAGGSGSGKTTFAQKIIQKVGDPGVSLLHQDSYYLHEIPKDLHLNGAPNFDHPESFDWDLLREHLAAIKAGGSAPVPVYDYRSNQRTAETQPTGPCRALIIEGIYTLWDEKLRDLFDLKVYLHVDSDIRFIRRLHRDVRERGRTLDSVIRQYYDTVRPMHHEHLEHTQQYADLVIGEESDVAAEVIAARVRQLVS